LIFLDIISHEPKPEFTKKAESLKIHILTFRVFFIFALIKETEKKYNEINSITHTRRVSFYFFYLEVLLFLLGEQNRNHFHHSTDEKNKFTTKTLWKFLRSFSSTKVLFRMRKTTSFCFHFSNSYFSLSIFINDFSPQLLR